MAEQNQDPNQPTLDAIDAMFNGLRLVSPFNDIGSVMGVSVPQEMDPGNGQIQPVGYIAPGAIDVSDIFVSTLMPPEVLDTLPTLPDTTYPVGRLVFLTTDGKLYRNVDDVSWTTAVDAADITVNQITAGQIQAGAIGATQLAAEIVLAGTLIAGDPEAAHLELDSDGLRMYDAVLSLLFNATTDGGSLYVNAQTEAQSLVVTGDAVFQGVGNILAQGSALTVNAEQAAPTQAPALAKGFDTVFFPIDATYDWDSEWNWRVGLDYDAAGGAGGATKVFWTVAQNDDYTWAILELLASDRTVNRSIFLPDLAHTVQGVCVMGAYIYVLSYEDTSATNGTEICRVRRYNKVALTLDTTYSAVNFPVPNLPAPGLDYTSPRICSNGTNIFIADKTAGSATIKWNKYDAAMVKVGSTIDTSYNSGVDDRLCDMAAGSFDFGGARIAILSTKNDRVNTFLTDGTRQADEYFPVSPVNTDGGITYGDALADGARFWSFNSDLGLDPRLTKHSTWVWTTASSIYWVAYAWYDSAGTTHETVVGPRASVTMGRRQQLTVTTQANPGAGGADEPSGRRIYMFPNATAPATTSLDLQSYATGVSASLVTYDSAGAAPSTTNGFAGLGTTAYIASATAGWTLSGDGTSEFTEVDTTRLRVSSTTDATVSSTLHGIQVGPTAGENVIMDGNEIMARDNGAAAQLFLNNDGGAITTGAGTTTLGGALQVTKNLVLTGDTLGYIQIPEKAQASGDFAAATGYARLYVLLVAGKAQLRVRFETGAVQTIATEP